MQRVLVLMMACGALALAGAAPAPAENPASADPPAATPAVPAAAEEKKPAAEEKKPPPVQIVWRKNLADAQQEAAKSGLCILLFFHADWCQPCHWMDKKTFSNPVVAQYVQRHFIPVQVDDTEKPSAVSEQYEIRMYPTVLFLSPAGDPLHIVPVAAPPEEFGPLLEQVAALPKLIEAQKKAPDDWEANFALGEAWVKLSQLKRAGPVLARAAELDPKNTHGRLALARMYLALVPLEDGDADAAVKNLEDFQREFKGAPEVPTAIFYQGAILYMDDRLEEARKYFERLRTEFPKHVKAYDADKAIEIIDARLRAIEMDKERAKARARENEGTSPPALAPYSDLPPAAPLAPPPLAPPPLAPPRRPSPARRPRPSPRPSRWAEPTCRRPHPFR